jgi:hypothetical protein
MRRFAYIEPFPLLLDASPAASRPAALKALDTPELGARRRLFGVVNGFKRSGP